MSYKKLEKLKDFEDLLPEYIESFCYTRGHGKDKIKEICSRQQISKWLKRDLNQLSLERLKEIFVKEEGLSEFTWRAFYEGTPYSGLDLIEEAREHAASSFYFYAVAYGDDTPWEGFMEQVIAPIICLKDYNHH